MDQLGKQHTVTAAGEDQKLQVLSGAYDEVMERIDDQLPDFRDLAKRVLSWITCARRPLCVKELQHALAVEFDEKSEELDDENLLEPSIMVSVCAGLVTIDDETSVIRLVHYTTQGYFERTQASRFPNAHLDIAKTCAKYLSYEAFSNQEPKQLFDGSPLYDYAAKHWGHHAREAETDCDEVMTFLQRDVQTELSDGYHRRRYNGYHCMSGHPGQTRGIHLAAAFGLERALRRLISITGGSTLDIPDQVGRTPLILAAAGGWEGVVTLLLATGKVDVNRLDLRGLTALCAAADRGREGVVRVLLATDHIDVDAWDHPRQSTPDPTAETWDTLSGASGTPLCYAADIGDEGIVRLLLATGKVDVNARGRYRATPIMYAAAHGHIEVVQLLLATGRVNLEAWGRPSYWGNDGTPLHHAFESRDTAILYLLLQWESSNRWRRNVGMIVRQLPLSPPELLLLHLLARSSTNGRPKPTPPPGSRTPHT